VRAKFITTYPPTNCGIATYSSYYVKTIGKLCDMSVVPVERPKANPLYFVKLALTARKGADVVHVQYDCGFFGTISIGKLSLSGMYTPLFYLLVRAFGGPKVVTTIHELQDARKNYVGRWLYRPMHLYYKAVYWSMAALSSVVLVHTRGTIESMSQYFALKNAEIVPHAVFIQPAFLPKEECKAKLGLSGKRVVTMFGYVSSSKGHELAIEAIRGMPADIVLYIAGDARTPDDKAFVLGLKEKVRALDMQERVRFHGYVRDEDTPVVMGATDLILMPYSHIVQSGAVNFALAYLKPVLASDIGGFAEIAEKYGCIETFTPQDIGSLREKLASMLSGDDMNSLIDKIRGYIREVNMDTIAARTAAVYKRILDRRGETENGTG